jgi:hypothetical protein
VLGDTHCGQVFSFLSSRGHLHVPVRGGVCVQRNKLKAGSRLRRPVAFFAGSDFSLQQGRHTLKEMKKGMTRQVQSGVWRQVFSLWSRRHKVRRLKTCGYNRGTIHGMVDEMAGGVAGPDSSEMSVSAS